MDNADFQMMLPLHGETSSTLGSFAEIKSPETSGRLILNDPRHGRTTAEKAGTYYDPLSCTNIARVDRFGSLMGAIMFSNYTRESIGMHSASWVTHWVTRDFCWMVFDYAFNQLGVKRVFGQVPEDNWRAQRFNLHVGFRYVARIEGVYEHGIACLVMCMDRADCRFLRWKPRAVKSNVVDVEADDGREG